MFTAVRTSAAGDLEALLNNDKVSEVVSFVVDTEEGSVDKVKFCLVGKGAGDGAADGVVRVTGAAGTFGSLVC